jgi:hypothetical protein
MTFSAIFCTRFGDAMAQPGEQLTGKQQRAITALIASRVYADAAATARVSERSIYRWLQHDEFRQALEAAQRETEAAERGLVRARVRKLMPDFLDKLEALFDSVNESVQVAALKLYLEFRKSEREVEIERRLEALEAKAFASAPATSRNGALR